MIQQPIAKQQFVIVREVEADAAQIFAALCTPDDMQRWVPMCRKAEWRHPPGVEVPGLDSVRYFTMIGGVQAAERIVGFVPGRQMNYRFEPDSLPLEKITRDYEGVTLIEPIDASRSRLTWSIHFDCPGALSLLEPGVRAALKPLIATLVSRLARIAEARSR